MAFFTEAELSVTGPKNELAFDKREYQRKITTAENQLPNTLAWLFVVCNVGENALPRWLSAHRIQLPRLVLLDGCLSVCTWETIGIRRIADVTRPFFHVSLRLRPTPHRSWHASTKIKPNRWCRWRCSWTLPFAAKVRDCTIGLSRPRRLFQERSQVELRRSMTLPFAFEQKRLVFNVRRHVILVFSSISNRKNRTLCQRCW